MGHRIKDEHSRQREVKKHSRKKSLRRGKQKKSRQPSKTRELRKVRSALDKCDGLPFADLLSGEQIQMVLNTLNYSYRKRLYDPFVTLSAFLSQMISKNKSCEAAVCRVLFDLAYQEQAFPSPETTSYVQARQRLPEELFWQLSRSIGSQLAREALTKWKWKDRDVFLVDGTTCTMADTEENQQEYPQHSNQQEGLGFPTARITVLISLSVGTVTDSRIGPIKGENTGEIEQFRQMFDSLKSGDIVLGDCLYDSYADIAELQARGVDCVFGMKQCRKCDFRTGDKLGPNDHIVIWNKPKFDSARFDRETWEKLPDTIRMRELMITVKIRGKLRKIRVVTTLTDVSVYSASDILNLFRQRWNVELDLRCLKTVMGMEHFACKSPSMVRKEFQAYLLAYNLIRVRMAQAAALHDKKPRDISFNATKVAMTIWLPLLARAPQKMKHKLERMMLRFIASHSINGRPGRSEPRKRKRRPSTKYPLLKQHRNREKQALET